MKYEKDYVKIVDKSIAYYIFREHVSNIKWEYQNQILALAQFAVNIKTNEVVKCRLSMETLIDVFTEV
jgi:hypothetical protein